MGCVDDFRTNLHEIALFRGNSALMRDALRAAAPRLPDTDVEELMAKHGLSTAFTAGQWRLSLELHLSQCEYELKALFPTRIIVIALFSHLEAFLVEAVTESGAGGNLGSRPHPGFREAKCALEKMGVDLSDSATTWDDLDELREKRNCLVHRLGIADCKYIRAARRTSLFESSYSEADELWPWEEHIDHHMRQAYELAQYLAKKLSLS